MNTTRVVLAVIVGAFALAAYAVAMLRWLRVLQREHYEPGSVWRFYNRWATAGQEDSPLSSWRTVLALWLVGVVTLFFLGFDVAAVALAALVTAIYPPGLSPRGRTSKLAWTRRLTTVAVVTIVASAAVVTIGALSPRPWAMVIVVLVAEASLVDLAAWVTRPFENARARRYVDQARERLEVVRPTIVAITGSFGKTSTKHHLAELLGARHGVLPTPRSYNNRAGLSRAINENLTESTKIFIAEMGVYGPGEIAEMCEWCPPEMAIVTAIGPVHLERMGSLEVVERAKFEITDRAKTVVLNVDDERLAGWVERLRAAGKRVVRAGSANPDCDVRVEMVAERWRIAVNGVDVGIAPPVVGVRETNLGCALAGAMELGVTVDEAIGRLAHLTAVPSRMVVATAPSGVMVIDDTFSTNPSGARSSLATLRALPVDGRRVVVTPGMVELGTLQREANARLGRDVAAMGAELCVVGRVNAVALREGFGDGARSFSQRDGAVDWVRAELRAGDAVLYLNDLPDHYP